ncbi:long-chain-fatty-acid-CoA ligase-like protein [Calycina marina]|uniref:Long-chain-fatty-acid-CoA ligase-like protein n=1 Tax=Calycina marina TaxID=1763456 RepID=A0A9P7ZCP4_9HELO|nr:long-chain-fatty-acid-CoA ligase-like protein [Calycina marina]
MSQLGPAVARPPFTVEVKGLTPVQGETIPRRSSRSPEKLLTTPVEGIATVFDIVKYSAKKYGDAQALGSRRLLKMHNEVKKVKKVVDGVAQEVDKNWSYFELSGYSYISFKEHETIVLEIGSGLRKLGLKTQDRVHMFASTSAHWLAIAHGAVSQSMAVVTAYDTLGEEGLRRSLTSTDARAIFLEPHLLRTFLKTLPAAKNIGYIILNTENDDDIRGEDLESLITSFEHVKVLKYEELRKLGESNMIPPTPPGPEDLCCIMYTSGSGGTPKGVPIKHSSVVASIAGINSIVGDMIGPGDKLLAYLPLAHIFEFMFENACLFWGGTMGYGGIRTLSSTSCRNCLGDIQECKPTLLIGVPFVWETVKKGVLANVNKASLPLRTLFWSAMYTKQFLVQHNLPGVGLLDATVLKKVKDATGGRLRFCMNGAAPIAKETQEFITTAIAPLVAGYGMTETTAMGAACDPRTWTTAAQGEIEASIEVKLVDFPDAGYHATNKPNPQGEVWVRGATVLEEYWQDEAATAEAIAPGGWFKTGDIGEWDHNGHLKIIDRKKNLIKTLNGEYIALEKLESIYRSATIVANICVYASITESNPIAIIVPAEPALIALAGSIGIEGHGIGDLVPEPRVQQEILKQLQGMGKKAGLASMEIIVGVVVADEEWTPQNNLTTATSKLNRKAIEERYKRDIDNSYKRSK